ncbi:MAG TPA: FtsX-like permease family protein [Planctomycetaceae bacterium]|jgi:putative ABC transport system permease protein
MSVPLAWRNATHNKFRTLLALSAITFAVVLIFMQLALFDTCESSANVVTDMFDYDLLLTSLQYYNLQQPGSVDLSRLYQARSAPGVATICPVYLSSVPRRSVDDGSRSLLMMIGLSPQDPVFAKQEVTELLPRLQRTDTALMDSRSLANFGAIREGQVAEIAGRRVEVAGLFSNGGGMSAGSLLIVSDRTFSHLGLPLNQATLGLIKLQPGADPATVAGALRHRLPQDVTVWQRDAYRDREIGYWVWVKPIGVMFRSGVFIGLVVGAVILYQVLANDISNRLREYATMKAIGYSDGRIKRTVLQQGVLYALASYLAGLVGAFGLYWLMSVNIGLPVPMTAARAGSVLGLVLLLSVFSGALALRKLTAANPADLF